MSPVQGEYPARALYGVAALAARFARQRGRRTELPPASDEVEIRCLKADRPVDVASVTAAPAPVPSAS
jgi:hypothetical protein